MTAQVLVMTKDMARQEWLEARRQGIGGSDASVVAGLNPWKSKLKLWMEKTGQIECEEDTDNEFIYWGNALEALVAQRFTEVTGKKVRRCNQLLQHHRHPFMLANVDRMVVGEAAGLECKTTSAFKSKEWVDDELPDMYYLQCQHYMAVTGYEKWYIAVLIGGNHFVWKEVARDQELIEQLIQIEGEFWGMVQSGEMPEVDGSEDCSAALKNKFKGGKVESIPLPCEANELIARYDQISTTLNEFATLKEEVSNRLKMLLGDNESGYIGERKVEWKTAAGRKTIDSKRLQKEQPAIYGQYIKISEPSRRFAVK